MPGDFEQAHTCYTRNTREDWACAIPDIPDIPGRPRGNIPTHPMHPDIPHVAYPVYPTSPVVPPDLPMPGISGIPGYIFVFLEFLAYYCYLVLVVYEAFRGISRCSPTYTTSKPYIPGKSGSLVPDAPDVPGYRAHSYLYQTHSTGPNKRKSSNRNLSPKFLDTSEVSPEKLRSTAAAAEETGR